MFFILVYVHNIIRFHGLRVTALAGVNLAGWPDLNFSLTFHRVHFKNFNLINEGETDPAVKVYFFGIGYIEFRFWLLASIYSKPSSIKTR